MRKAVLCALVALLMLSAFARHEDRQELNVGEVARPLWGWVQFCLDNPTECNVESVRPEKIVFSDAVMMNLRQVNSSVNLRLKYLTDKHKWGDKDPRYIRMRSGKMTYDKWSYEEESGDCEDYVLLKQRALLEKGYPRSALLITIVEKKGFGELHAVLTVITDKGDFILDNRTLLVLPWWQTVYTFLSRQSQEHPNKWLTLEHPKTTPVSGVSK